jgi:CubicO group peptidase (beta-lactamase class C family)
VERIARDEDIAKGLTQIQLIRAYARKHPDFLRELGKLPRSLTSYANIHYLLVVWDHWFWIDPEDGIAVVSFDALLPSLKRGANLQNLVAELLRYEWLPVEGRDFRVNYVTAAVNGALLESSTFSPAN